MTASTPTRGSPIATLFPGYFALTMATGIVAVGAAQQQLDLVANSLFLIALAAFIVLAVLSAARLIRYPKALISDLTHHSTGFSFLTVVAALNVLGSGAAVIHQWWTFAWVVWIAGVAFWLALLYPPLLGVILGDPKPKLGEGINGTCSSSPCRPNPSPCSAPCSSATATNRASCSSSRCSPRLPSASCCTSS